MKTIKIFALLAGLLASVFSRAADSSSPNPLGAVEDLLKQEPLHARSAVPPKSLAEFESEALVSSPEIRLMLRRIAVAESKPKIAGSREDPAFMYRGWGTPLQRPWDLNQTQHMFMYNQALPGPGKRALRAQVAEGEIEVAKAQLEANKRDVAAQVRKAFYDLRRNQDELRLHDEQASLARQALEQARIKYVVGKVPQQDVLKAQIALTKLVEHLVMLEQEGSLASSRLNTLVGRDPAAPVAVEGKYVPPDAIPSLLDLERAAIENRPDLAAATASIHQEETKKKLAEKGYTPDYNVSAGYMLMPDGARYRNTYMAELSVTLPWLNRGRHDAEIAESQAQITEEQAEYDYQRSVAFQEIQEALVRARSAKRLVDLYRDTLRPQAEASLKSAVIAYQTDRTDLVNLLDSQNTTLDVELAYYRSVSELESNLADLERATGAPLNRHTASPLTSDRSDSSDLSLEVR
jgi:outer membrane protein, heavy metal efflux system